jgi:SPP1 gp7 family putative phage head morphogenesis protein
MAFDEINLMSSLYNSPGINEIKKDNKKDYTLIYALVAALLLDYEIVEERLKLTTTERVIEYKKANDLINKTFGSQIKDEIKKVTGILKNTINSMINFRFKQSSNVWKVSNKDVEKILNATIEGKNYSDRIYDNKNEVAKVLKKQIKDLIDGKTSVNEIKTLIKKKFDLNDFNTNRLVENEISRVCRALDEQYFIDNNIQELVYVGKLDEKICERCFNNDGTEYNINDSNRPKLPLHVSCRCYYAIKK